MVRLTSSSCIAIRGNEFQLNLNESFVRTELGRPLLPCTARRTIAFSTAQPAAARARDSPAAAGAHRAPGSPPGAGNAGGTEPGSVSSTAATDIPGQAGQTRIQNQRKFCRRLVPGTRGRLRKAEEDPFCLL